MNREREAAPISAIPPDGRMAGCIRAVMLERRPRRIIETGTHCGMGSTSIIAETLLEMNVQDAIFFSIEVNPDFHRRAVDHLYARGLQDQVHLLLGLSIRRDRMPSLDELRAAVPAGYRHTPESLYADTDFPEVPDDLLSYTLARFGNRPDMVLLDSGNNLGWLEFQQVIGSVRGKCVLVLDDTHDLKHARSYGVVTSDPRFTILHDGDSERAFVIAEFDPGKVKSNG